MKTTEEKIDELIEALNENTTITKLLYEMLDKNDLLTEWLFKQFKVLLSPELEMRNFGINFLATIIGNTVQTPKLVLL